MPSITRGAGGTTQFGSACQSAASWGQVEGDFCRVLGPPILQGVGALPQLRCAHEAPQLGHQTPEHHPLLAPHRIADRRASKIEISPASLHEVALHAAPIGS